MENYTPLSEIAKEFDLMPGENIYLASDITRLVHTARKNGERFDPVEFLSYFQKALTESGNILIPAFNHNLKKNSDFNPAETQPITGILSQYALRSPGFLRTYNALHSFAVWGKNAKELSEIKNESSFSEESPFGWLNKNKSRMLAIDLDLQSSLTFAHYSEEAEKVKYRSWKKIPVHYQLSNGKKEKIIFRLFAKKPGYINNVNPMEEVFMENGALIQKDFNGINLLSLDLQKAHQLMTEEIRNNKAKRLVFFNTTAWAKSMVKSAIGRKK